MEKAAGPLPPALNSVLAWTVREGVTNVIRHSRAQHCVIRVRRVNTHAGLTVSDDGHRGRAEAGGTGNGLAGLRERAAACGADVQAEATDASANVFDDYGSCDGYGFGMIRVLLAEDQGDGAGGRWPAPDGGRHHRRRGGGAPGTPSSSPPSRRGPTSRSSTLRSKARGASRPPPRFGARCRAAASSCSPRSDVSDGSEHGNSGGAVGFLLKDAPGRVGARDPAGGGGRAGARPRACAHCAQRGGESVDHARARGACRRNRWGDDRGYCSSRSPPRERYHDLSVSDSKVRRPESHQSRRGSPSRRVGCEVRAVLVPNYAMPHNRRASSAMVPGSSSGKKSFAPGTRRTPRELPNVRSR